MTTRQHASDNDLLNARRGRLVRLRDELLSAINLQREEAQGMQLEAGGGARESEDDAQALMLLELGEDLASRDVERLAQVERALAKFASI